jgi:hypothetical protein
MQLSEIEVTELAPGVIEKYKCYRLFLDVIGGLMKKGCALYTSEVNAIHAKQIKRIVDINSFSETKYRVPRKHPVRLKLMSNKRAYLNKIETFRVDVQFNMPETATSKIISLQKILNSPNTYPLNFVLDNHVIEVKDEYRETTKKWVRLINTLNQLSAEFSLSLRSLLRTYKDLINFNEINPYSSSQYAKYIKMDFSDSIEQMYSQVFMHHKGYIDDIFMHTQELKKDYFNRNKKLVTQQGKTQRSDETKNQKGKYKRVFNPITFRIKIGRKFSLSLPNGEFFLSNITVELRVYSKTSAIISKNIKPVTLNDGTKKFVLEMVANNRFHSAPHYLLPIIDWVLVNLNFVLAQKRQVFSEIHSLRNLLNEMDKSNDHITFTKR